MGYSTKFELLVLDDTNTEIDLSCLSYEAPFNTREAFKYIESGDPMKWYDHEDDMKLISLQFPKLTFVLTGFGEESTDIWRKFFKNGVVSGGKAKIIFPEPQ